MLEQTKQNNIADLKDISEIIRGLKPMNDLSGCHFLLSRLGVLAKSMRDDMKSEVLSYDDINVIACLQEQIVNQIMFTLDEQDKIIMKLQTVIDKIFPEDKFQFFEPCPERLSALRSLESLFNPEHLYYHDAANLRELKTWCTVHDFDLEKVKDFLGSKENKKPAVASL